jgi:hypothetical protein
VVFAVRYLALGPEIRVMLIDENHLAGPYRDFLLVSSVVAGTQNQSANARKRSRHGHPALARQSAASDALARTRRLRFGPSAEIGGRSISGATRGHYYKRGGSRQAGGGAGQRPEGRAAVGRRRVWYPRGRRHLAPGQHRAPVDRLES